MNSQLRAEHIQKSYRRGKQTVLRDVSFTAESGQCIGILGANGCGKSTLLSILAGVQPPDSGRLFWNDNPLTYHTRDHDIIGYVPQENPLMEELSAYDNLRLWYCDSAIDLETALRDGVPAMLGIPDFLKTRVSQMSGGMKKRLSISCAVADDPHVLLLDEPGAALDLVCKERISVYLKECKSQGKILLLATHEEREIELCDKIYILKNGVLTEPDYDGNIHHLAGLI
ncbi:MAG: ATP-binding cassette domain-containing protein [Eubacterium sp.]|nr:ATP-binding cassette domain-containing protein [Eubacterium sp.]